LRGNAFNRTKIGANLGMTMSERGSRIGEPLSGSLRGGGARMVNAPAKKRIRPS